MNTSGIIRLGNPVLRIRCREVTCFPIHREAAKLLYFAEAPGRAGVAAPQTGSSLRMFAATVAGKLRVFVNPVIVVSEGSHLDREGCLSVPDRWFPVERPDVVHVEAVDDRGQPFSLTCYGFDARSATRSTTSTGSSSPTGRASRCAGSRQQRRAVERELAKAGASS